MSKVATALKYCQHGDLKNLKLLLDSMDDGNLEKNKRFKEENHMGLLLVSTTNGRDNIVRYLIEIEGYEYIKRDGIGRSLLDLACIKGHESLVKYFIQLSLPSSLTINRDHPQPLHYACESGNLAIVQRLLDNRVGSVFDRVETTGRTPLHYACIEGHTDVVKYLLEYTDADINATDNDGHTPLDLIESSDLMAIIEDMIYNEKPHGNTEEAFHIEPQTIENPIPSEEYYDPNTHQQNIYNNTNMMMSYPMPTAQDMDSSTSSRAWLESYSDTSDVLKTDVFLDESAAADYARKLPPAAVTTASAIAIAAGTSSIYPPEYTASSESDYEASSTTTIISPKQPLIVEQRKEMQEGQEEYKPRRLIVDSTADSSRTLVMAPYDEVSTSPASAYDKSHIPKTHVLNLPTHQTNLPPPAPAPTVTPVYEPTTPTLPHTLSTAIDIPTPTHALPQLANQSKSTASPTPVPVPATSESLSKNNRHTSLKPPPSLLLHIDARDKATVTSTATDITPPLTNLEASLQMIRKICVLDYTTNDLSHDYLDYLILVTPFEDSEYHDENRGQDNVTLSSVNDLLQVYPDYPERLLCLKAILKFRQLSRKLLDQLQLLTNAFHQINSSKRLSVLLTRMQTIHEAMTKVYDNNKLSLPTLPTAATNKRSKQSLLKEIEVREQTKNTYWVEYAVRLIREEGDDAVLDMVEELALLEDTASILLPQLLEVTEAFENERQFLLNKYDCSSRQPHLSRGSPVGGAGSSSSSSPQHQENMRSIDGDFLSHLDQFLDSSERIFADIREARTRLKRSIDLFAEEFEILEDSQWQEATHHAFLVLGGLVRRLRRIRNSTGKEKEKESGKKVYHSNDSTSSSRDGGGGDGGSVHSSNRNSRSSSISNTPPRLAARASGRRGTASPSPSSSSSSTATMKAVVSGVPPGPLRINDGLEILPVSPSRIYPTEDVLMVASRSIENKVTPAEQINFPRLATAAGSVESSPSRRGTITGSRGSRGSARPSVSVFGPEDILSQAMEPSPLEDASLLRDITSVLRSLNNSHGTPRVGDGFISVTNKLNTSTTSQDSVNLRSPQRNSRIESKGMTPSVTTGGGVDTSSSSSSSSSKAVDAKSSRRRYADDNHTNIICDISTLQQERVRDVVESIASPYQSTTDSSWKGVVIPMDFGWRGVKDVPPGLRGKAHVTEDPPRETDGHVALEETVSPSTQLTSNSSNNSNNIDSNKSSGVVNQEIVDLREVDPIEVLPAVEPGKDRIAAGELKATNAASGKGSHVTDGLTAASGNVTGGDSSRSNIHQDDDDESLRKDSIVIVPSDIHVATVTPANVAPVVAIVTPTNVAPVVATVTSSNVAPVVATVTSSNVAPVVATVTPTNVAPVVATVTPSNVAPVVATVTSTNVAPVVATVTSSNVAPVIATISTNTVAPVAATISTNTVAHVVATVTPGNDSSSSDVVFAERNVVETISTPTATPTATTSSSTERSFVDTTPDNTPVSPLAEKTKGDIASLRAAWENRHKKNDARREKLLSITSPVKLPGSEEVDGTKVQETVTATSAATVTTTASSSSLPVRQNTIATTASLSSFGPSAVTASASVSEESHDVQAQSSPTAAGGASHPPPPIPPIKEKTAYGERKPASNSPIFVVERETRQSYESTTSVTSNSSTAINADIALLKASWESRNKKRSVMSSATASKFSCSPNRDITTVSNATTPSGLPTTAVPTPTPASPYREGNESRSTSTPTSTSTTEVKQRLREAAGADIELLRTQWANRRVAEVIDASLENLSLSKDHLGKFSPIARSTARPPTAAATPVDYSIDKPNTSNSSSSSNNYWQGTLQSDKLLAADLIRKASVSASLALQRASLLSPPPAAAPSSEYTPYAYPTEESRLQSEYDSLRKAYDSSLTPPFSDQATAALYTTMKVPVSSQIGEPVSSQSLSQLGEFTSPARKILGASVATSSLIMESPPDLDRSGRGAAKQRLRGVGPGPGPGQAAYSDTEALRYKLAPVTEGESGYAAHQLPLPPRAFVDSPAKVPPTPPLKADELRLKRAMEADVALLKENWEYRHRLHEGDVSGRFTGQSSSAPLEVSSTASSYDSYLHPTAAADDSTSVSSIHAHAQKQKLKEAAEADMELLKFQWATRKVVAMESGVDEAAASMSGTFPQGSLSLPKLTDHVSEAPPLPAPYQVYSSTMHQPFPSPSLRNVPYDKYSDSYSSGSGMDEKAVLKASADADIALLKAAWERNKGRAADPVHHHHTDETDPYDIGSLRSKSSYGNPFAVLTSAEMEALEVKKSASLLPPVSPKPTPKESIPPAVVAVSDSDSTTLSYPTVSPTPAPAPATSDTTSGGWLLPPGVLSRIQRMNNDYMNEGGLTGVEGSVEVAAAAVSGGGGGLASSLSTASSYSDKLSGSAHGHEGVAEGAGISRHSSGSTYDAPLTSSDLSGIMDACKSVLETCQFLSVNRSSKLDDDDRQSPSQLVPEIPAVISIKDSIQPLSEVSLITGPPPAPVTPVRQFLSISEQMKASISSNTEWKSLSFSKPLATTATTASTLTSLSSTSLSHTVSSEDGAAIPLAYQNNSNNNSNNNNNNVPITSKSSSESDSSTSNTTSRYSITSDVIPSSSSSFSNGDKDRVRAGSSTRSRIQDVSEYHPSEDSSLKELTANIGSLMALDVKLDSLSFRINKMGENGKEERESENRMTGSSAQPILNATTTTIPTSSSSSDNADIYNTSSEVNNVSQENQPTDTSKNESISQPTSLLEPPLQQQPQTTTNDDREVTTEEPHPPITFSRSEESTGSSEASSSIPQLMGAIEHIMEGVHIKGLPATAASFPMTTSWPAPAPASATTSVTPKHGSRIDDNVCLRTIGNSWSPPMPADTGSRSNNSSGGTKKKSSESASSLFVSPYCVDGRDEDEELSSYATPQIGRSSLSPSSTGEEDCPPASIDGSIANEARTSLVFSEMFLSSGHHKGLDESGTSHRENDELDSVAEWLRKGGLRSEPTIADMFEQQGYSTVALIDTRLRIDEGSFSNGELYAWGIKNAVHRACVIQMIKSRRESVTFWLGQIGLEHYDESFINCGLESVKDLLASAMSATLRLTEPRLLDLGIKAVHALRIIQHYKLLYIQRWEEYRLPLSLIPPEEIWMDCSTPQE